MNYFSNTWNSGSPFTAEELSRQADRHAKFKKAMAEKDIDTLVNDFGFKFVEKKPTDLSNLNFWQALTNKFTGNYDYQRQLEQFSKQAAFNAEEAQKQRDYEMKLANTAYQRQVADLGAAGYNPALALGAGGAFVPSGASASASAGSYHDNTRGFEFTMNAILAAVGLGIKAAATGASSALAIEKAIDIANLSDSKKEYFTNAAFRNFMQGHFYDRH